MFRFFPRSTIKASVCKITHSKSKDDSAMHRNLPWMEKSDTLNKEFRLQVRFFCQVNFSVLQLEVCSQLLQFLRKSSLSNLYISSLCTCETTRKPFEGFLLNSRDNIQTLHHSLCWRYIFTSDTLTQLFFSCIF